jgi:hypothetical protein
MPPGCFLDVARVARAYLRERGVSSRAGLDVPVAAICCALSSGAA